MSINVDLSNIADKDLEKGPDISTDFILCKNEPGYKDEGFLIALPRKVSILISFGNVSLPFLRTQKPMNESRQSSRETERHVLTLHFIKKLEN